MNAHTKLPDLARAHFEITELRERRDGLLAANNALVEKLREYTHATRVLKRENETLRLEFEASQDALATALAERDEARAELVTARSIAKLYMPTGGSGLDSDFGPMPAVSADPADYVFGPWGPPSSLPIGSAYQARNLRTGTISGIDIVKVSEPMDSRMGRVSECEVRRAYRIGEWHEWKGGECPVEADTMLDVRLDGKIETGGAVPAGGLLWDHAEAGNITTFRPVTPAAETPAPIDWSGALETEDGREIVPNQYYWGVDASHRILSDFITRNGQTGYYGWIGELFNDGCWWLEDGTPAACNPDAPRVRNRVEAPKSADGWGPEILVNGVKPKWLAGDVSLRWHGPDMANDWWEQNAKGGTLASGLCWGPNIHSIRLPVDHWAYPVIAKGFEPWAGGDTAPDDWDGVRALRDDFAIIYAPFLRSDWPRGGRKSDIIGYRKRT